MPQNDTEDPGGAISQQRHQQLTGEVPKEHASMFLVPSEPPLSSERFGERDRAELDTDAQDSSTNGRKTKHRIVKFETDSEEKTFERITVIKNKRRHRGAIERCRDPVDPNSTKRTDIKAERGKFSKDLQTEIDDYTKKIEQEETTSDYDWMMVVLQCGLDEGGRWERLQALLRPSQKPKLVVTVIYEQSQYAAAAVPASPQSVQRAPVLANPEHPAPAQPSLDDRKILGRTSMAQTRQQGNSNTVGGRKLEVFLREA
ncbi:hypothetical protein CCM_00975 [Cordyceps militaris CM01]|uniref:Uncharacterized protein n=1 Tax=Cordyceps militaris (strain CM01) TaxID=983644 RepID=G3J7E9_CORMM|nr:uncharacterized protein CCM_00975 [Cordyceps militaris CM01]EGX96319.1 hypothetical protein CCM_00975 [Cordyceps militaris CM01]